MDRTVTTTIDEELCNGCGLCVTVCPAQTITMAGEKAKVTGDESLNCGHCEAVCPTDAIKVRSLAGGAPRFATFETPSTWLKPGAYPVGGLVHLMRSRRSCRHYATEPVKREVLEDLVAIGITAPSGSNAQLWSFTVLPDRRSVDVLARAVAGFFKKLNAMAANPGLRLLSKVFMKDALGRYHREYHRKVSDALREYDATGKDPLFHGAPSVIVISMKPGASCPGEDALLAAQNIQLAAHAMGYGTCLIGFAVEAMKHAPAIKKTIGLPAREKVYAVITVGRSKDAYKRVTGRKKITPRYVEG